MSRCVYFAYFVEAAEKHEASEVSTCLYNALNVHYCPQEAGLFVYFHAAFREIVALLKANLSKLATQKYAWYAVIALSAFVELQWPTFRA